MTDKPIIFSGPMVRALLEGRKSMTRRVLKPQPVARDVRFLGYLPRRRIGFALCHDGGANETLYARLPCAEGDCLWVREAHAFGWPVVPGETTPHAEGPDHVVTYRADGHTPFGGGHWRSPIHMPRWASRLTLTVTDVRVQRVQWISAEDTAAEGASASD
ncbi:MAG: hypothetical protein ACQEUZ_06355, partial [Pseudomonadota bacterium]